MIETYTFQHGATTYTYTSTDDAISRGSITSSMVSTGELLQIDVPRDNAVALLFRHYPPSERVSVTISATGLGQIWAGYVQQVRWHGSSATLECVDELSETSKLLNPHRFSRNCRHVLYDEGCGLSIGAGVPVNRTIVNIDGRLITLSTPVPPRVVGGVLEQSGTFFQILECPSFTTILLLHEPAGLDLGACTLYSGCDRTIETCHSRFSNAANFGGFPAIKSSPFFTDLSGPDVED